MNALTKLDVVKLVSLRTNQSQAVIKDVLNGLVEEFKDALKMGRKVEIRGFGILETRISKERVGRNPSRPDLGNIMIPPRRTVRFRIAPDFGKDIAKVPAAKRVVRAEPLRDVT